MKTAVIYARYSCDNQTEQSIEGQLRVCHDYAERNGILPYGYKSEGKKIVIDPERAEAVQFMYEQFSMGVCVRSIINELTARGILHKGKPFTMNTVYGILKNEKYSGIYRIGDEVIDNMYHQN